MKLKVTSLNNGDPEPKKKKVLLKAPPKYPTGTYQTQAEVDAANAFAKDFSQRGNYINPGDAYVARKPGDPIVKFNDINTGKPYTGKYEQMPQSMIKPLPDWVTELQWDKQWNMPYYLEGDTMNYVDKHWFNHPRFIKSRPEQDQIIAMRNKQ